MAKLFKAVMFAALFSPGLAYAQSGGACTPGSVSTGLCNVFSGRANNIQEFLTYEYGVLAAMIGTICVIMLVYGAGRMVFSQGKQEQVTRAKDTMKYAAFGLIMTVSAFLIVNSVRGLLRARDVNPNDGSDIQNPVFYGDIESLVTAIVGTFLGIVGTVAIMYLVIGGFRYITAGGNEEQLKSARGTIRWAVIGIIMAILSYTLVTVLINALNAA